MSATGICPHGEYIRVILERAIMLNPLTFLLLWKYN